MDADLFGCARQLAFMQQPHSRQAEDGQGRRAMFRKGKEGGDALFVMVFKKVDTGVDKF